MKREELRYFYATDGEVGTMPLLHNCFVYPKEDVDHLLDEKDAEIESLKAKLESVQASAYADSVDAGMRERRLRRALWFTRSYRAWCEIDYWEKCYEHADYYFDVRTGQDLDAKRCERMISKWIDVKSKCLKKAEEYK